MTLPDQPASIIVIDGDPANLVSMQALLAPLGYQVVLVDNAADGLAHAYADEVALIVADVRMPGMEGLETLARLRRQAGVHTTPVVFTDAQAYDSATARRAFELGAVDYIARPIDVDILRAKLKALITLFDQARAIEHRDRIIADRERETHIAQTLAVTAAAQADFAAGAVREKDRYIGVLGHDLRNPLSALLLGLEAMKRSSDLPERLGQQVARMFRSAARMRGMVTDLLDYTRSSVGTFPHHPVAADFGDVCESTVEELRTSHPARSIVFQATGNSAGLWDVGRVQQAVSNLVGNALQHSSGAVTVSVESTADSVVLTVHNDGEPIAPEVLPVMFEPFRKGDRSPNGLGLGLYITREIVHRHGGSIEVKSSSRDGTRFISRWPRVAEAPSAPRLRR